MFAAHGARHEQVGHVRYRNGQHKSHRAEKQQHDRARRRDDFILERHTAIPVLGPARIPLAKFVANRAQLDLGGLEGGVWLQPSDDIEKRRELQRRSGRRRF